MRSPIRSLAVLSLFFLLGACSPGSAPPAAQVKAPKPPPHKSVRVAEASLAPSPEVVEALARATRAAKQPAAIETKAPAPVARALPRATSAHGPLDTAKLGSRGLLRWLPPDATLVLRFPHVESLGEIRRRTSAGALLQNPAAMMALCAPEGPLGQLTAKIHAEWPELEALLEKLPELQGELVVGLAHFELAAKEPKATLALAFDAGAGADDLQQTLDPLLARLQRECGVEADHPEGAWGLVGWSGEACFEIRRFGDVFTALYGNDPEFGQGFQPESEPASFASAPVVASAADLNQERQGVFEFYLNAEPAWELVKAQAPPEAQAALEKLGLFGVQGASLELGLGLKGMAEAHTWSAPAHADIVSRVFAGAPAQRELARWIPEDAASAGLHTLDLRTLYETIVALLPEAQRAELRQSLAQSKKQTRIDLVADVIENFGPSFAVVTRGDAFGLSGGPAGMCLAIETHDDDKVGELIGKLAPLLPPALKRRNSEFAGHALLTYDLSALGMAVSSITLCRVDGALLVATDEKLLERCLQAGREPGIKQLALAAALAGEDVIGASLLSVVGDLPSTLSVMRRTEAGLTVSAADGSASTGSGALLVLPIVSSIAIPKLMAERLEANQKAAEATMWSIASAEAVLVTCGSVDVDRDGHGEYGTFGDLSGRLPLRGSDELLEPAILPAWFEPKDGVVTRNGYHFLIYLPSTKQGAYCVPRAKDGSDVCADDAEIRFIAQAWPVDAGSTGNWVFVLDQEGDLMACENRDGKYSGLDHRPAWDAYLPAGKDVDRASGKPYKGRDGQTWQLRPCPIR